MADRFLPQEFIAAKRNGDALSKADIKAFVSGISDESVTEGQIAAFAMAVFFQGMSPGEVVALTLAMRDSGEVLNWAELDGPVVDKHSTGGVGDNVSLMLAPALAALGAHVPMISGRGLGHTGGTLDKLDSIPGYTSQPDSETFRRVTRDIGCAIIGQTGNLAPADKRFYGIRDVTATVESVPLITASILSKKLAAGLGGLVLDVKCGNGAFMNDLDKARELARSLVTVANGAGLPTTALLTDMNAPLASAAGNAVEVQNALDFLTGRHIDSRLWDVTIALCAEMAVNAGVVSDLDDGRARVSEALQTGKAAEHFARMVAALGGPTDLLEAGEKHLPHAPIVRPVHAEGDGLVTHINARTIGMAVVAMGGGRVRATDKVDPAVGLTDLAMPGDHIDKDVPLGFIHARDENQYDAARRAIQSAYTLGTASEVSDTALVIERISA